MENARKCYGLSDNSPLLAVPASFRLRCHRAGCVGSECQDWRYCGPASPFGTYLSHLSRSFVSSTEGSVQAPSIPA